MTLLGYGGIACLRGCGSHDLPSYKWQNLRELNNFNGVMEVVSAINSSPVRRLKKTWEELSVNAKHRFDVLDGLMNHNGNYRTYRQLLHASDPPLIPYLGVYLTDLTFIEEGNPNLVDGRLINFDKRFHIADVIQEIQQYQSIGYEKSLSPVEEIQHWICTVEARGEEETFQLSVRNEPKKTDEALEKLLMEEEKLRREVERLHIRNADLEVGVGSQCFTWPTYDCLHPSHNNSVPHQAKNKDLKDLVEQLTRQLHGGTSSLTK